MNKQTNKPKATSTSSSKRTQTVSVRNQNELLKTSSSFIRSMLLDAKTNTIQVVMARNPKVVYTYQPTVKGLSSLTAASRNGKSMGTAYNRYLKGREISRTIYR